MALYHASQCLHPPLDRRCIKGKIQPHCRIALQIWKKRGTGRDQNTFGRRLTAHQLHRQTVRQ
ncbi:MAG: hypothetical protein SNJ81_10840, partial [Cyanobacteriota bacterium]